MTQLRERHLGVLEGLTRLEAAQQHPADFANLSGSPDSKPQVRAVHLRRSNYQSHPPSTSNIVDNMQDGESQREVAERVVSRIEQIASKHSGISATAACCLVCFPCPTTNCAAAS